MKRIRKDLNLREMTEYLRFLCFFENFVFSDVSEQQLPKKFRKTMNVLTEKVTNNTKDGPKKLNYLFGRCLLSSHFIVS
jgi:hypothetical protein